MRVRSESFAQASRGALLAMGIVSVVFFAATSLVSPMNGEDFALGPSRDLDPDGQLLSAIFERSWRQASGWNARFGEQLAILWLHLGERVFCAANAIIFAAMAVLIASYARGRVVFDERTGWLALASASMLWLLWPLLEVFFWTTTAGNYFHPVVLMLTAGLPFFLSHEADRFFARPALVAGFCVAAFLAGASSENGGATLIGSMALAACFDWRSGRRPKRAHILVFLAFVTGWAALMLAPSTALRVHYYRTAFGTPSITIPFLRQRLGNTLEIFSRATWILGLVVLLLVSAVLLVRRGESRVALGRHVVLAVLATLGPFAVIFAPYTEGRAFTLTWACLIVLAIRSIDALTEARGRVLVALSACGALASFVMATAVYREYAGFASLIERRDAFISAHRGRPVCESGLEIELVRFESDPRVLNNREAWVGASLDHMSHYYGCRLILANE